MPQGDKDKYTDKQTRKAEHIAEGAAPLPLTGARQAEAPRPKKGWETRRRRGNA